jgi:DNA-binding SARP family transcriptional activator
LTQYPDKIKFVMKSRNPATRARSLGWRLELLGGAILSDGALRHRLERKTAGLLALLALEGERSRSTVAGLLWANNDEQTARTNLRQCLYRLKKLVGTDLVQTGEHLSITTELEVDTVTLESRAFLGDDAGLIAVRGEILEQFDFEDCPEFSEWLEAQRLRWRNARIGAYRRALHRPDSSEALEWARDWINLEPLSEEAHRALARAYASQGNRALALQTLRELETLLKRELNTTPSSASRNLYTSLERDAESKPLIVVLPADVRQPPLLAGREREWALLKQAWADGLDIIIRGAAGVGKTRLMLDFVASKTKFDLIAARPGDLGVPMSAFARSLRQILLVETSLKVPAWVKTELARLIPEFGTPPPAMTSEADKDRFYEALFTVSQHRFAQGISTIALDDLQFMDAASFDAALVNTERARRLGIRTIAAYRSGDLSPELEAQLEREAALGRVQIIELEPLEEVSLSALVTSLHLNAPKSLVGDLQRSTGGNPLYALETIRDLLEQDRLSDLKPSSSLTSQQVIAQRFERRSPEAQRIAQVAAVAGEDFTLELAAFVLDCKPLDLQDSLLELEQAQIMLGERFSHDLWLESVFSQISLSVRRFLHRRCAEFLAENGDSARVAEHWLEGGEPAKAVPYLVQAAERCDAQGRVVEAKMRYEQAGLALMPFDQPTAFEYLNLACHAAMDAVLPSEVERLLNVLNQVALIPLQRVVQCLSLAEWCRVLGETTGILSAVEQGLLNHAQGGEPDQYISLLNYRGTALQNLGQLEESVRVFDQLLQQGLVLDQETRAIIQSNRAVSLNRMGRPREAFSAFTLAIECRENSHAKLRSQINQALTYHELGQPNLQLERLQAVARQAGNHENIHLQATLGVAIALVLSVLEQYKAAIMALERIPSSLSFKSTESLRAWAALLLQLGEEAQALARLDQAQLLSQPPGSLGIARLLRARITNENDDWQSALSAIQTSGDHRYLRQYHLTRCPFLVADEALAVAQNILLQAQQLDLPGVTLTALVRITQAQLRLGLHQAAKTSSLSSMQLLTNVRSPYLNRTEILLTHALTLQATADTGFQTHLEQTLETLLEISRDQVPSEYRESFLNANPTNRATLELARASGIDITSLITQ